VTEVQAQNGTWRLKIKDLPQALAQAAALAGARGLEITELRMDQPSLEEAFLSILDQDERETGDRK